MPLAIWLGFNRILWSLSMAVWVVVLSAGTYLGRVHLHSAGALSLAFTFALGLAYVLSHGRRGHRALGIAANGLLGIELAVYFARLDTVSDVRLLAGVAVAVLVVGVPLALLIAVRPGGGEDGA